MQTYYVQISDGQNNFDPNYSSSAFGPGFKPEHLSPLMSRLQAQAESRAFSVDYQVEYDVNFKQFRRNSVYLRPRPSRASRSPAAGRARCACPRTPRSARSERTRCAARPRSSSCRSGCFLEGSADYDIKNDILYQSRAQLRYAVQCCGFTVEYIRFNYNGRDEKQWRFNLELANIGSMGNFLGAGTGGAGGAYR